MTGGGAADREPVGTFCLVLHTHLPWLAHHGAWPVGEEWLHQAWSSSYLPVLDLLERLAAEGRRELVTLGMTPVLAAQLDDPYCLEQQHVWLGFWQARAEALGSRSDPRARELGSYEFRRAQQAFAAFERRWTHGASPVLAGLADSGAVELLGGPATHPFQPLTEDRVVAYGLQVGRDDARQRLGRAPAGIWAPECGYRPGLERLYAAAGVGHLLVDGPTLLGAGRSTAAGWRLGDSDVVAFGRDLEVSYRVWSPRRGYPGGRWYRDFHTLDHDSGFRPARVTSTRTPSHDKAPYDPARAAVAVESDARDFVEVVRGRLADLRAEREGRPGMVVAAYDTELFGHWWHEGPQWLERVLRLLPEAGIRVTTLNGAREAGLVEGAVWPGAGSWGSGKDWRVWDGPGVADLVESHRAAQHRVLDAVDKAMDRPGGRDARDPALDQLVRQLLLLLASDWAFMVTKDSAAGYARDRAHGHASDLHRLADLVESGRTVAAAAEAARQRAYDGPFGHLDARLL
ncbi:MAG: 1,4-alpha-glucan branching protein domain-containing protein [Candidatus Nanopelagicales bacterium]